MKYCYNKYMKKIVCLIICLLFASIGYAEFVSSANISSMNGIYKKDAFGRINQYDKNGKKIGVYKIKNGRRVKIK